MKNRLLPSALALLAFCGCSQDRDTAGGRGDIDPSKPDSERIKVDYNSASLRSALKIEGALCRNENGFLVVQVSVRNKNSYNLPCEWRTTFQDKDGFDLPVTADLWSPVVLNSNVTTPLTKTAPVPGADKAVFYIREAAPIRK